MTNNICVVIQHFGCQDYVKRSVEINSKHNDVILLGNQENANIPCHKHYIASDFETNELRWFRENFVNYSTNNADFERICFERIFILHEFMLREGHEQVFYSDSDCVVLYNVNNLIAKYPMLKNSISIFRNENSENLGGCVHNSFLTRAFCHKFMRLCIEMYCTKEKQALLMSIYSKHTGPGGICDMTIYGLMCEENGKIMDLNIPILIDGELSVFEHNMNSAYGWLGKNTFAMNGATKYITKNNNKWYAYLNVGTPIRILSMHFSSSAKQFITTTDF